MVVFPNEKYHHGGVDGGRNSPCSTANWQWQLSQVISLGLKGLKYMTFNIQFYNLFFLMIESYIIFILFCSLSLEVV